MEVQTEILKVQEEGVQNLCGNPYSWAWATSVYIINILAT